MSVAIFFFIFLTHAKGLYTYGACICRVRTVSLVGSSSFYALLNFLEQLRTGVDSAFTCHSLKRQEILYQHRAHGVFVCRSKEPS